MQNLTFVEKNNTIPVETVICALGLNITMFEPLSFNNETTRVEQLWINLKKYIENKDLYFKSRVQDIESEVNYIFENIVPETNNSEDNFLSDFGTLDKYNIKCNSLEDILKEYISFYTLENLQNKSLHVFASEIVENNSSLKNNSLFYIITIIEKIKKLSKTMNFRLTKDERCFGIYIPKNIRLENVSPNLIKMLKNRFENIEEFKTFNEIYNNFKNFLDEKYNQNTRPKLIYNCIIKCLD
uniref:Uncharacterized protein n=1 Tax=viral metagenome TaxID=1070528 RepID=A0A6C0AE97_9ZZZZ